MTPNVTPADQKPSDRTTDKARVAALVAALATGASLTRRPDGGFTLAPRRGRGRPARASATVIEPALVDALVDGGWVRLAADGTCRPTPRALAATGTDPDALRRQHQVRQTSEIDGVAVEIDLTESPLRWLASRRDGQGRAFLGPEEIEAGERFRQDFTLAGLSPALSARWDAPAGGRGSGALDYADVVLAARQRLNRAIDAVGPDLADLLLDVCGFLKGLEAAEAERHWPARTAKVVLKLGLAALARHYGLGAVARGPARGRIRAWTAEARAGPG
jgi:hypothetical protein